MVWSRLIQYKSRVFVSSSPSVSSSDTNDRGRKIGSGLRWTSNWALRVVLVAAGIWVVGYVLGKFWSIILPVVLALFITSVLWPVVALLSRRRWSPALAAVLVLLSGLAVDSLTSKLQSSATGIAAGVFAGVTSAVSLLVTARPL
jgi:hypothetical protein